MRFCVIGNWIDAVDVDNRKRVSGQAAAIQNDQRTEKERSKKPKRDKEDIRTRQNGDLFPIGFSVMTVRTNIVRSVETASLSKHIKNKKCLAISIAKPATQNFDRVHS